MGPDLVSGIFVVSINFVAADVNFLKSSKKCFMDKFIMVKPGYGCLVLA